MTDAERRFARVFSTLTRAWSETLTFRKLVELGLPAASSQLAGENYRFAISFLGDPANDNLFLDKQKALETIGGPEGMGTAMTKNQLAEFKRSVDSASLVFIHSALDAAATDLCAVTALLGPGDWEHFVKDKTVPLSSLKGAAYDTVLQQKLNDYLKVLERESLLKRIDKLFQVCQPPDGFDPKPGYKYDRTKLENLDTVRHEIVHGDALFVVFPEMDNSLECIFNTGLFLFFMVNAKYGVKLDPVYFQQLQRPPDAGP